MWRSAISYLDSGLLTIAPALSKLDDDPDTTIVAQRRKSSPSIRGAGQFARGIPPLPTLQALVGKCMEWDAPVDEACSRYGIWTRCHKRKPWRNRPWPASR